MQHDIIMKTNAAAKPNGILCEMLSPIDGSPLVAIATCDSKNTKTGDMVQVWILRADMLPTVAVRTGSDSSICGFCPHRATLPDGKGRSCYVPLRAPQSVYRKFARGGYQQISPEQFAGYSVRWGAYGDPAMIPESVVREVNLYAKGHTGYTHQYRYQWAQWARGVFMASVDTMSQEQRARRDGWGTFRVALADGSDKGTSDLCAAERKGAQCFDCMRCDGRPVGIYIPAHGAGKNNVPAARLLDRKRLNVIQTAREERA